MVVDKKPPPKTCDYPKTCGWTGTGCKNLLCRHLTKEAVLEDGFFLRKPKKKDQ